MSVECPELDEYRRNPWGMSAARSDGVGSGGYVDFTPKILADAAIAALEDIVTELEDAFESAEDERIEYVRLYEGANLRAEQAEAAR